MIWFIRNLFDCYGNKNIKVSFIFSEDKKIRRIDLDFGIFLILEITMFQLTIL